MKVGIKYCGGCNPIFDRKKLVESLSDEYSNVSFEPAKNNVFYDVVLIVNGCGRACAEHSNLNASKKIFLNKPSDIGKTKKY
jgi:4-hydroxybutyrate CoA-transferase